MIRLTLLILCVALPAAGGTETDIGPLGRRVAGLVAAGADGISVLPVADGRATMAAWSRGREVRVALLTGAEARIVWSERHPGGYEPVVEAVPGWMYRGSLVVMVRYQLGAAYTHVDFYGFREAGPPVALGQIEAALVERTRTSDGAKMRIYETADLAGPAKCRIWNQSSEQIQDGDC